MKTTTKQALMGLALGAMSFSMQSQCPTSIGISASLSGQSGIFASANTPSVQPSSSSKVRFNVAGNGTNYTFLASRTATVGFNHTFSNLPAGSYSVCATFIDSLTPCASITRCASNVITIASATTTPPSTVTAQCPTSIVVTTSLSGQSGGIIAMANTQGVATSSSSYVRFNVYGSTGSYSSGSTRNANGSAFNHFFTNLPAGSYSVCATFVDSAAFCPAITRCASGAINVANTNSTTPVPCNASFNVSTDTACVTRFVNTSTGSGINSRWNINGNVYTSTNVSLSLPNGAYTILLSNYNGSTFCDSAYRNITVSCNPTSSVNPTNCSVNSNLQVFADTTNPGNYFAYNLSSGTGNLSYSWDFGDGTTSTLRYPFHQYATPGQYIICLTVSATNGSLTCTDTECDSSSVQRIVAGFFMSQLNVVQPAVATGIKTASVLKSFNAYPNPLLDELTIAVELAQATTKLTYSLVDALGKVVASNTITDSKTTINTSTLDKGFYFLSITNEQGNLVKSAKLVK